MASNFEARSENDDNAGTPLVRANQLAAKALQLQLRMKGKHDEAVIIIISSAILFWAMYFH